MQAFKKPLIALAISVSRQVIFLVPSIILFVEYFKLRLLGIWVGTFIVIWLAAIVTTIYVTKLIKEKEVTQK
ncbi:hypothetical protein HUU53_04975 [Candidatus Micrarchaeota archaeon]|nr:hypothetical protein [Candidatus Micrarchaeota archaeon]